MAINGWRLDPAAFDRAISDAETALADMATAEQSLQNAAGAAESLAARAVNTATALSAFKQNPGEIRLASIGSRVTASVAAARSIANAYASGDEEMAANANKGIEQ